MQPLRVIPMEPAAWRELAPSFRDFGYRQTLAYASVIAERRRATNEFLRVERDGATIAVANVRIRQAPLGVAGLAFLSWGPLVRRSGADVGRNIIDALQAIAQTYGRERGLVVRADMSPWYVAADGAPADLVPRLGEIGYKRVDEADGYRTFMLRIDRPLDVVRAELRQKWRNCLNRAERNGLEIVSGDDQALFEAFDRMFHPFVSRKKFDVDLGSDFYAEVQRRAAAEEGLTVSLARIDGEFVAGHLGSDLGDTSVYLLGTTTERGLKGKAAYLLQWDVIERAHRAGRVWYDLGGIDPEHNPGVHHFKRGLGGVDVTAPGPFEFVPSRMSGRILRAAERVYQLRKRMQDRPRAGKTTTG